MDKTFRECILEKLRHLPYEDCVRFAWLCAVRALPFLEAERNFYYYRHSEDYDCSQVHLLYVLRALDVVCQRNFAPRNINGVDKAHDIGITVIYDKIFKCARSTSVAAENSAKYFIRKGKAREAAIFNSAARAAGAATYVAILYCISDVANIIGIVANAAEAAVDAASLNDINLEHTVWQDLEDIRADEYTLNGDISIYGDIWGNYQTILHDMDCGYWADWYIRLFENGFRLDDMDRAEIELRMNVQDEILKHGAAAVASHIKDRLPIETLFSKIFLSYCHADKDLADIIDNFLLERHSIKVTRDVRDVRYKDSFKDFMQTIGEHDYVVMLISDSFLKSRACMYEAGELVSTRNLEKKLLFVILQDGDIKHYKQTPSKSIGANIYNSIQRNEYITYWENQYIKEENSIGQIKSDSAKIEPLKNLRELRKIIDHDISLFLDYISDAKGKSFSEMYEMNFSDIVVKIKKISDSQKQ